MSAGHSGYFLGQTPTFACQADQRFSYCLHVPTRYAERTPPARMLVAIHDTLRNHIAMRDAFSDYAEKTNTLVLAPLFPGGIGKADDLDNYKYLRFQDIRFDELLLHMTAEVAKRYGVDEGRFSLFGFSGGAHFAHRFLYVRPERLASVVVASPGSVTMASEQFRWWPGLADFAEIFGRPVPWDAIRRVPVHLVVGGADTNPRGIISSRDSPNWMEGADAAGANRVERLRTLHQQLRDRNVPVTFEELPGVAHEMGPITTAAIGYFTRAEEKRATAVNAA